MAKNRLVYILVSDEKKVNKNQTRITKFNNFKARRNQNHAYSCQQNRKLDKVLKFY